VTDYYVSKSWAIIDEVQKAVIRLLSLNLKNLENQTGKLCSRK